MSEWEQDNIKILTSRQMGAWLGHRDNRLLQQISDEIMQFANTHCSGDDINVYSVIGIIDRHIHEDNAKE